MCAKFDQFLPLRFHFDSKRPETFVRIATFPSATFGPLLAFHCPLFFFTKNNKLRTLVKWCHGSKRFNFTGSWSALYLIGDAARVGYFVPLNGPLNGHPPSYEYVTSSWDPALNYVANCASIIYFQRLLLGIYYPFTHSLYTDYSPNGRTVGNIVCHWFSFHFHRLTYIYIQYLSIYLLMAFHRVLHSFFPVYAGLVLPYAKLTWKEIPRNIFVLTTLNCIHEDF